MRRYAGPSCPWCRPPDGTISGERRSWPSRRGFAISREAARYLGRDLTGADIVQSSISRLVRFSVLGVTVAALTSVGQAQRGGGGGAGLAARRPLAIEDYYKVKTIG